MGFLEGDSGMKRDLLIYFAGFFERFTTKDLSQAGLHTGKS